MDNYPDTLALVQMHLGCSDSTPWGNDRHVYYSEPNTPAAFFDGVEERLGSLTNATDQYDWYEGAYLARRALPTDITIQLAAHETGTQTYRVGVQVCIEPGGVGKTLRICVVQVLDYWPRRLVNWTRNGLRQAADTEDITLVPGECQTILREFTFDTESWGRQDDIKIIAWAQEPENSSPPGDRAEIFQAGIMPWPFPLDCNSNGVPDDQDITSGTSEDCNNNDVPDECDIDSGTSLDTNENGIPDECECVIYNLERGDCNNDGSINTLDIDPFVEALTNPGQFNTTYAPIMWQCVADINCDGTANSLDIDPFTECLTGSCPTYP